MLGDGSKIGFDDRVRVLTRTIERLELVALPTVEPQPDLHEYVPLPADDYVEALATARLAAPGVRLLEVGCGIGTKLALAHLLDFKVAGVEIRPAYANVARRLVGELPCLAGWPSPRVIRADVRTWTGFEEFDTVYCNRSLVDEREQADLETRLVREMRRDAVLILPFRRPLGEWRHVGNWVWVR